MPLPPVFGEEHRRGQGAHHMGQEMGQGHYSTQPSTTSSGPQQLPRAVLLQPARAWLS